MYAVVDDRNQQFRAEPGKRVQLPHNESWEPGASVTFDKICLVTGDKSQIGAPYVDGVSVTATVLGSDTVLDTRLVRSTLVSGTVTTLEVTVLDTRIAGMILVSGTICVR